VRRISRDNNPAKNMLSGMVIPTMLRGVAMRQVLQVLAASFFMLPRLPAVASDSERNRGFLGMLGMKATILDTRELASRGRAALASEVEDFCE
jgi:hypothetical protein